MSMRPRMLKEFLQEDTNSSGFIFRQPHSGDNVNPRNLVKSKPHSRSRSAFQAMVNALIKNIPFSAVKSPSILPRTLSRKLSKKQNKTDGNGNGEDGGEMKIITVRVKDIIRWKSFRDLVEEKSQPLDLDLGSSPLRCTTTTTTTSGSCSSSRGSSWCDSDFTSEYLPDDEDGKKNLPSVGGDLNFHYQEATNWVGPKEDVVCDEEKEQHSPLSVLDFEGRDGEEPFSCLGEESVGWSCEWGLLGHTKEWCVREMDKGGRWSKFDEEQHDMCLEIENELFTSFIDDLCRDLVSCT